MTRCRVGDLAVIVRSTAGNEGKVVTCVQYLGVIGWRAQDGTAYYAPGWEIDRLLPDYDGDLGDQIEDSMLRPLRDPDGDDETMAWAGEPIHFPAATPAKLDERTFTTAEFWDGSGWAPLLAEGEGA